MQLHLSQSELTEILKSHAESQGHKPVNVTISIATDDATYIFPGHIGEIFAHCQIKGIVDIGESSLGTVASAGKTKQSHKNE